MASSPTANFLEELRQHCVLERGQLDELGRKIQGKNLEPRTLAQKLIEAGWLTPYQARQLLQGRGEELVIGQYVVLEQVGEGGMGQVFKARHTALGRLVALKVIRKERLKNPKAVRRFQREVEIASKLSHPNIVMAYDAGQAGNTHYFAMEYVEGIDLAKLVQQKGALPIDKACAWIPRTGRQGPLACPQHRWPDLRPVPETTPRTTHKRAPLAAVTSARPRSRPNRRPAA